MTRTISLTAGVTLRAAEAIRSAQETFTREQVAYLMHLAYDSGRTAAYREDLAEVHSVWADAAVMRQTYEQRVTQRITDMAPRGDQPWNTWAGQYPGGPVDWETGRLVHHLQVAA